MSAASLDQMIRLRSSLSEALTTYCKDLGQRPWSFQGGSARQLTYMFPLPTGVLLLGVEEEKDRWSLALALEDDVLEEDEDIETSCGIVVPTKDATMSVPVEFESLGDSVLQVLHNGTLLAVGSSTGTDFFRYYDETPAQWPVLHAASGDRLLLCTLDLDIFLYPQVYGLFSTLADLADYISWYRDDTGTGR